MDQTPSYRGSGNRSEIVLDTAPADPAAPPEGEGAARGPRRGWPAALCGLAVAVAVAAWFGTPARDMASFGAYLALAVALPGTLVVRALYRGRRTAAEEVALGLAAGYALEVLAYLPARAFGAPRLVLAWPVATYLAFLLVPGLRRFWRSGARVRAPRWASWTLAASFAGLVVWSGVPFFRNNALSWPAMGAGDYDESFHLALVAELRHHMPPRLPMVPGEPLLYHWFTYAHVAASSWVTGVEPAVLVLRLTVLPMLAAFLVLIAMTARRVAGSWRITAPVLAGTVFVGTPNLYLSSTMVFGWGGVQATAWRSPTQTFGALLFAALAVLVLDALNRRAVRWAGPQSPPIPGPAGPQASPIRGPAGHWALTALLVVAVMGAKAVYLPLLLAGLVAVIAIEAALRRRPLWPGLLAAAMTLACLAYAQLVLFGNARQGILLAPLFAMRQRWQELGGQSGAGPLWPLGAGALLALCLAFAWCGVAGLLADRRLFARRPVVFLLAMAAAGHAATLLFYQPGYSQFFFLFAVYPYLVIVTVYGARVLLRRARVPIRATAGAVAVAVLAVCLVAVAWHVTVPLPPGRPAVTVFLPYLTVLAGLALAAVALAATLGRRRAAALLAAAATGVGLLACGYGLLLWLPAKVAAKGLGKVGHAVTAESDAVPEGALAAARWLRDHSAPGDLVATNSHCHWGRRDPCDAGQFWAAALTERRVLVEGWRYTTPVNDRWRPGQDYRYLPFWDPGLLRRNDAAINTADAAALGALRDRHHVRWLLVDRRLTGPGSPLDALVAPRFRSGEYAVYRLPDRA
ncbi:hypothetical protein Skr01_25620 [Sphaerisporangium krabiense]|uniref:Uncharacterized protein n=1 Tax=Sphaerisporangium krabiense TaxID=763782 RepID=A0A7W8ZAN6_9ACTN|nr:hypothetical protein [Sphaerisporangium krabiense]MBB5630569.1 hypothetical protein [Sphaerisporangium krabiense]GII62477.1 hypothetical protein Skr01_25620 [Sphaerisporangium krabiense]